MLFPGFNVKIGCVNLLILILILKIREKFVMLEKTDSVEWFLNKILSDL
jgi:hypothetical protein